MAIARSGWTGACMLARRGLKGQTACPNRFEEARNWHGAACKRIFLRVQGLGVLALGKILHTRG